MNKSKIYGAGNETIKGEFNISYYILEKDEKFLDWLALLLKEVLEIEYPASAKFWILNNEDGSEELIPKDINKFFDYHERYSNKGERVDIFYGEKRVFVVLRKSREIREKFASFLLKTREWIKVDEFVMSEMREKLGKPRGAAPFSVMK